MTITKAPLPKLDASTARSYVGQGAALVDPRPVVEYLAGHVHGSLSVLYEAGPGFASRARDCLPLGMPLILVAAPSFDLGRAAASLRGKGFEVLGFIERIPEGASSQATEVVKGARAPEGTVLDVGDPGAEHALDAVRIPIERLWDRVEELDGPSKVIVAAGYGVRAALAIGILERAGVEDIVFWRTR